jgi:glycosyltransferase involved in cell wall biosynthesis
VIEAYARKDPRIRVKAGTRNRGVTIRQNEALALAKWEFIARMDADDISEPRRLERQLKFLKDKPDVVLVGSRVLLIDADGDPLMEMGDALAHEEIDHGLMTRQGQLVYQSSCMFRKSAALAIGGYDERYTASSDLDFFLKLAEVGRLENLAEPLTRYRQHFNSIGYARLLEQEEMIARALVAARARRGLPQISESEQGPSRAPASKAKTHRIWGWWALEGGRPRTALKHALRSLAHDPFHHETARLFYCALRDSARPAALAAERKA